MLVPLFQSFSAEKGVCGVLAEPCRAAAGGEEPDPVEHVSPGVRPVPCQAGRGTGSCWRRSCESRDDYMIILW